MQNASDLEEELQEKATGRIQQLRHKQQANRNTLAQTAEKARQLLQRSGTSYLTGPDPRGEIAVEYGVTGIPEKYFVDAEGQIRRKLVGAMDEDRLSRILDELLDGG